MSLAEMRVKVGRRVRSGGIVVRNLQIGAILDLSKIKDSWPDREVMCHFDVEWKAELRGDAGEPKAHDVDWENGWQTGTRGGYLFMMVA